MHILNSLLPSIESQQIEANDRASRQAIQSSIHRIRNGLRGQGAAAADAAAAGVDVVDGDAAGPLQRAHVSNADLGRLFRLVNTHNTLKYDLPADLIDEVLSLLYDVSLTAKELLPIPMKIKALKLMKTLCEKGKHLIGIRFQFSWRTVWQEITLILSRDDRFEASASEHLVSMHLTSLVDFMHSSRRCVSVEGCSSSESLLSMQEQDGSTTMVRKDSVRALLHEATVKLSDQRYPTCIEGLLMLVNCLPTDLPDYEQLLPRWMHCWLGTGPGIGGSGLETASASSSSSSSGLTRNAHWDYAWLTLIARARKYCPPSPAASLFWRRLLPVLFSKALELMQIPANTGMEASKPPSGSDFPHSFHAHYSRVLLVQSSGQAADDPRSKAVKKIAKLIHFITVQSWYRSDDDPNNNRLPVLVPSVQLGISPPFITSAAFHQASSRATLVLPGCVELLTFLQSLRPFFYPSNSDAWTTSLASFFLTYVLQLCRHVGHSLASTVMDPATCPPSKRHLTELHLPTVQYLVVHLLPFCLEGVYSKNAHMASYSSACLKNLLAVHPSAAAPIVLPFLLAALDPEAVSQAHRAPVALQTLTSCFRCLMYPQPMMLKFLPDVLRLSLAGIEPSDVRKTSLVLHLYSTILAWLPTVCPEYCGIASTYDDDDAPTLRSYIELIEDKEDSSRKKKKKNENEMIIRAELSSSEINDQYEELSRYMCQEWCDALLKKFFALLEAQEAEVEGAAQSPLTGSLGQCAAYLFQSLRPLPVPPPVKVEGDSSSSSRSRSSDSYMKGWQSKQLQQTQLRTGLQSKVIQFFQNTTPLNAAKASAKLMEAMVTSDPAILPHVLNALLTVPLPSSGSSSSLTLVECYSAEKVAFRLRLAGGALRCGTSSQIVPCLPSLLLPIVTSSVYFNHEEKSVRTAVGKLLKDLLKGATSIYPVSLQPNYAGGGRRTALCAPNVDSENNIQWHVLQRDDAPAVVDLLRQVISQPMEDIRQVLLLPDASSTALVSGPSSSASIKKTEEMIVSKLWMIEKALRGAAEILGDGDVLPLLEEESSSSSSPPPPIGMSKSHPPPPPLLSTGRDEILADLGRPEDRQYLASIRLQVAQFLQFFQEEIQQQQLSGQQQLAPLFILLSSTSLSSLRNNLSIQKLWTRLLNLLLTRRMSCLKDVDSMRQMMESTMKNSRTSMTNIVYQRMKRLHAQRGALLHLPVDDSSSSATTAWGRTISSLDYWRSHDSSTSAIACIAWIQHVQRTKELSFAAVRLCVDDGDAFMSCLELLAFQLCSHEYEQTRKDALKGFEAVSGRFGSKMLRMVRRLVDRLCLRDTNSSSSSPYPDKEVEIEMVAPVPTPALTYFTAAGTLSLLGQGRVQKRIVGDMELLEYVLRSLLLHSQEVLLGCTTEPDKQEKLMHSLVELLIKYLKHWCIHPQTENGYMRRLALTCVGFYPPTMMMEEEEVIRHSDEDLLSAFIADILKGASSHAAGATGLRLESFASFMVLHSIGRPTTHELPLPNSSSAVANDTVLVWKWVLQTLLSTQQQGQPSQTMALASMSRLAWLTYLEQQPQGAGSVYCRSIPYVRSMLSPTSPHCCLRSLLTSASQSHPRDSDDGLSAQWGRGISQMIQAAKFMWMIFPRRLYGYACRQMYSSKFRKEDAAMYMSLVLSGLMGSTDELFSSSSTYTSGAVGSSLGQLFSLTDHLPAANEGEERANNTTRAELFAGIYRAYRTYCSKTAPAVTSSSCSGDRDGSEQVLLSFFRSSVEKASLDYSKDWQEAVYFALADIPCQRGASSSSTSSSSSTPGVDYFSELIPTYIVDKVQQLLISQQQTQTQTDLSSPSSSSSAAASAVESDQVGSASDSNSFASQAKVLQFATALLLADQEACYSQLTLGPQQSGVEQDKVASSSTSSIAPSMKDSQSQVGLVLLQLLEQQDGSSLISPFRSTRLELAHLLTLLALNNSDGQQQAGQQVSNTLQKIAVACQQFNLKLSLQQQQQQQQPSPEEETGTVDVTSQSQLAVSEATHTAAASAVLHKNTAETVCLLVSCGIQRLPMWRVSVAMRSLTLSALLSAGSMTSSALETARMCHGTCMLVTGASVRTFNPSIPSSFNSSIPEDLCAQLLQLFDAQSKDPTVSLHSKETLVKCTALLMGDNWFCLSNDERKVCKDIFARGLDDPKPEVQQLAQAGMIAYLSYKSVSELASIAAIYTKNSDILADREKKLKRLASKADEASSDSSKQRHNTVLMMSCVLLATPYDLPPYVPALITSLCRHISISSLRDTITRTVQLFKRTHQDRWDSEFKALFTLDQLAELQGTGAAHYYS